MVSERPRRGLWTLCYMAGIALLISACEERQTEAPSCDSHPDAVSCLADKACGWRTDMGKCKALDGREGAGQ